MQEKLKLQIEFRDLEDLKVTQIDLLRAMQCTINSEIKGDTGFHALYLIEVMSEKIYEVASEAIYANSKLITVA